MFEYFALLLVGILAGGLGGMLGIGGGIVMMPVLRFGLGLPPGLAAGTCMTAVFCTTLGGSYRHLRHSGLRLKPLLPVIGAGVVAVALCSWCFALLAPRGRWLDLGVGLVIALIAGRMMFQGLGRIRRTRTKDPQTLPGSVGAKMAIGGAAGTLPGLLGIGTGGVLVPAFSILLSAPVKTAMAASLFCFAVNAGISAGFKLAQGYVVLGAAVPLGLGTLVGAYLGALGNRRFSSRVLSVAFGLLFAFVAIRFMISGFKGTP